MSSKNLPNGNLGDHLSQEEISTLLNYKAPLNVNIIEVDVLLGLIELAFTIQEEEAERDENFITILDNLKQELIDVRLDLAETL